jgi:(p)ppGpp synthase/HD superfamily hydrolase
MKPKVKRAKAFAELRHSGLKYGAQPYTVHLEAVYQAALEFGLPADYLAAAWLHDVLEDTDTSYEELRTLFGRKVSDLVEAVTGRGENRTARQADIVEKLRKNPDAVALKLLDRLANARAAKAEGLRELLVMYRKEWPAYSELFNAGPEKARVELLSLLDLA